MNRTKKSLNNGIWSILSQMVALVLPFIVRTVLIRVLGVEYLGLGSLFSSILRILNLTELGFGSAIVFSMYKPYAEGDTDQLCALMNEYRRVYRLVGLAVLVMGAAVLPFLPHLIEGDIPAGINLYALFTVYLANAVMSYWLLAYRYSILYACERSDVVSIITIAVNFLMYSSQIALLFLTRNYYLYIIALPVFSGIKNIIVAVYSRKIFPDVVCRGRISPELKKDISLRVSGLMINRISYASRNAFDSIIISFFLGLQSVGIYNNYYYIINAVSGIMTVVISAIVPTIGNSIVLESKEKNERDMKTLHFVYIFVSGLCFCFFLNLFQPFMKLWVGEELRYPELTMIAFSVYFLVEKSENIVGNYFDAAGIWWHGKWKGVIEAAVNLALNIILCRWLGAFGVVLATIISMLLVGIPLTMHYLYKFYFEKNPVSFLMRIYRYMVVQLCIGAVSYLAGGLVGEGSGTGGLILCMGLRLAIAAAVYLLSFYLLFRRTGQYRDSKEWIMQHLSTLRRRSA